MLAAHDEKIERAVTVEIREQRAVRVVERIGKFSKLTSRLRRCRARLLPLFEIEATHPLTCNEQIRITVGIEIADRDARAHRFLNVEAAGLLRNWVGGVVGNPEVFETSANKVFGYFASSASFFFHCSGVHACAPLRRAA